MATNPLRQVILNGRHYNYEPGSYNKSVLLRNSVTDTQNTRNFSVLGAAPAEHSIKLILESSYTVRENTDIGITTWNGTSRLADLELYAGAKGVSQPIHFVAPNGVTHLVVPTGAIDISEFLVSPKDSGVEWRVSLTLAGATVVT